MAVHAAGHLAAVFAMDAEHSGWPPTDYFIVVDLVTGAELYRVPIRDLLAPEAPGNFEYAFDIAPDGTIVIEIPDYSWQYGRRANLYWASPAEPTAHQIPTYGGLILTMRLHDGLLAVRRQSDWAVVNLRGETLQVFDTSNYGRGRLDFDGKRLVWASDDVVRNEPYPAVATIVPQASVTRDAFARITVKCTASQRCKGTLALKAKHTRHRFGSARFAIPGNARRTIRIKLNTGARRALALSRTLRAAAELHARASGISIQSNRPIALRR
jgi:hypothetical protein